MISFKNAATMIATAAIATGLAAGSAFASDYTVHVTVPDAFSVGNATLPGGAYTIQEIPFSNGAQGMFVFRDHNGKTAAVAEASKTTTPTDVNMAGSSEKSEVVLTPGESGQLHLDQMFVQGDTAGFSFLNGN